MHNTHLFAIFHFALSHSQNLQKLLYWKFLRQFFLFCCSCGSDASFHISVCTNTVYSQCTHNLILRSVIFYKLQKIQGVAHNRWWPTAGYITLLLLLITFAKKLFLVDRLEIIKLMENTACKYGIKKITLTKVFKFLNLYCTRRNRNHLRAHVLWADQKELN